MPTTAKLILTIEKSKEKAFLEMLKLFDFGILEAKRMPEVDLLEDLSPEFIADLESAALDDDLSDTVTHEEASKMFRAWAEE